MSQDERLMILQMVADKKITAAEAAELLKALDHREPEPAKGPQALKKPPFRSRPTPPPVPPVLSGLGSFIENVVEKVTGSFASAFEPRYEFPTELTGEFTGDVVPIRIVTGNGRVVVRAWDEPGYKASILAKAAGANEDEARTRANSAYTVKAGADGFELEVKHWDWGDTAVHVTLLVPRGKTYRLDARTGNGSVELEGLSMIETQLDSGNGKIFVRGGSADRVTLRTGVGSVDIEADVANLDAQTGSGSLHIMPTGSRPQLLQLNTGNGSVHVQTVKVGAGAGFKVEVHTGLGGVNLGLPSLTFDSDVRSSPSKSVRARTVNFETASVPVTIIASTGMGSVTID